MLSGSSSKGVDFMAKLDEESRRVEALTQARVALLPSTTMQQLWIFIAVSDDSYVVPNILLLMNVYCVIDMHTAKVERGFSLHRILKNRLRNRLMILMVDSRRSSIAIWTRPQSCCWARRRRWCIIRNNTPLPRDGLIVVLFAYVYAYS
jgi:hypothetical protein